MSVIIPSNAIFPSLVSSIITPANTTLMGTTVEFGWADTGEEYWLVIGRGRTNNNDGTYTITQQVYSSGMFVSDSTVNVGGLPVDGSDLYTELTTRDSSGVESKTYRNFVAHTAVVTGSSSLANGMGLPTSDASFAKSVNSATDFIQNMSDTTIMSNFGITIAGPGDRRCIELNNCHNVVIEDGWVWAPHQAPYYLNAHNTSNNPCVFFLINANCSNITFRRVNFFGGHHQVWAYRGIDIKFEDCLFARPYRHAILLQECRGSDNGGCIIERCYGYAHPDDMLRGQNLEAGVLSAGSMDMFNFITCVEPNGTGRHIMRGNFCEGGWGVNGSHYIIDGGNPGNSEHTGKGTIEDCLSLHAGNKVTAISAGRNNVVQRLKAYQGPESPCRFHSSTERPMYIADFSGNGKALDFSNNVARDNNMFHYVETDRHVGTQDALPLLHADTSYAFGWPPEANNRYENNDFEDASLTKADIRTEAGILLQNLPVYAANNEMEDRWINL